MHIISKRMLREFWEKHPHAEGPLQEWHKNVKKAQWTKFADIRAVYSTADLVGKCVVFNLGGNKFRLIVIVSRDWKRVYVRFVMTHREYDRGFWKKDYEC